MKLTIPKSSLSQALAAVSAVTGGRASLPYLQFAKLATMEDESRIQISATDLECFYTRNTEAEVESAGACLLPVGRVKEWLGKVPGQTVTIDSVENSIKLKTEITTGVITFKSMPFEDFPKQEFEKPSFVAEADFAPIKHVAWSMLEANAGRPMLEAVFIEPDEKGIICASTDGRKVGTVRIEAKREMFNPIALPARYVSLVAALGKCQLLESKSSLHFLSPQFNLICRKTDHGIPPWRKSISNDMFPVIGSITVMRDELASAVDQCHVFRGSELGSEYGVRVTMVKTDGGMNVSCLVDKTAEGADLAVDGRVRGEFPNIVLSTEHIAPFLGLQDESPLKIEFTGSRTMVHMDAQDLGVDYYFAPMFAKEAAK